MMSAALAASLALGMAQIADVTAGEVAVPDTLEAISPPRPKRPGWTCGES